MGDAHLRGNSARGLGRGLVVSQSRLALVIAAAVHYDLPHPSATLEQAAERLRSGVPLKPGSVELWIAETAERYGPHDPALQERAHDTRRMAGLTFRKLLYPAGHPYSRSTTGYVETIPSITRDDLESFYRARIGAKGMLVVIVGAVKAEAALASCTNRRLRSGSATFSGGRTLMATMRSRTLSKWISWSI
jgi:hypothetical protein